MHSTKNHVMKGNMNTIKPKIICEKCKGNGYIKLEVKNEKKIFQCWICNSQGEIYEQENINKSIYDIDAKQLH